MKIQKTSIKKTLVAAIILSGVISLTAFETMVYGQGEKNKNSVNKNITGEDQGEFQIFSHFPVVVIPNAYQNEKSTSLSVNCMIWNDYLPVLDKIKYTHYPDLANNRLRFTLQITTDRKDFYDDLVRHDGHDNSSKTELIKELSENELDVLYETLKNWFETRDTQFSLGFRMVEKDEFLKQNYLIIKSYISPVERQDVSMASEIFSEEDVDKLAEPIGGMGIFLNNIALNFTKDVTLILSELPDIIEFEFVVGRNGMVTQVNLLSKIKGNTEYEDEAYKLMGALNKNILKYSLEYGWKPAIKNENRVSSLVKIEIPKSLL